MNRPAGKRFRSLPWARIAAALIYVGLLLAVFVYEYNAYALLAEAREQQAAGNASLAAATGERLAYAYSFSTAVPEARQIVVDAGRTVPRRADRVWGDLHPLHADWLPLWALPGCAVALACVCLTRLGRRNRWAVAALALALVATFATLMVWGWYGYPAGGWLTPLLRSATPLLDSAAYIYGLAWAMIVITAAMMLCPLRRRQSANVTLRKPRPASPNDPRMALQRLAAQRAEMRLNALEYVRRREAILSRI